MNGLSKHVLLLGDFLTRRKQLVNRSTTATRLSQKSLVSLSAIVGFALESWGIAGAFLKGLSFDQMEEAFKKKGVATPNIQVFIRPPQIVWDLLR